MRYKVPLSTSKQAKYIDKETIVKPLSLIKAVEYLPNKLTLFNSEIYYKEENYLKVKTAVFKYITPFYSKGLVYKYAQYIYNYII